MANDDFYNARLREFNCYDYAAGNGVPTQAVPGAAGGAPMKKFTGANLREGLMADGAVPAVAEDGGIPPSKAGYRLIAAALDTSGTGDFHFYRQEADGLWSHKFNNSPVSHVGADGQKITNPQEPTARNFSRTLTNGFNGRNYTFIGYFYVPQDGLKLAPANRPEQVTETPERNSNPSARYSHFRM